MKKCIVNSMEYFMTEHANRRFKTNLKKQNKQTKKTKLDYNIKNKLVLDTFTLGAH